LESLRGESIGRGKLTFQSRRKSAYGWTKSRAIRMRGVGAEETLVEETGQLGGT